MKFSNGRTVERGHQVVGKTAKGETIEGTVVTIVHDGQSDHALIGVSVKAGGKPGSGRVLVGDLKSTDFLHKDDVPKASPEDGAKTN